MQEEPSVLDDLERPEDEARHDEEQHQQHPLGWHKPQACDKGTAGYEVADAFLARGEEIIDGVGTC